ncbi:hypothetical protein [Polyangium sp. 6x1]|uniref:hypothetical protein n=1 Tax=Polyangium sp. 6x1 TaxID=3042689 RepID=UPI0024830A01|nr:hypothetical protein [Polyangium sp. 6x1]MDI1444019.1 hypothetical protein [Polyangium sp. 6x1]
MQRVRTAKEEARIPGARQAQEYASAVHEAYKAGDYRKRAELGATNASDAISVIDRAIPTAGVDAPTLVAWRATLLLDSGKPRDAYAEYHRSFEMGPNEIAGKALIEAYGQQNRPDLVGPVCAKTVPVLHNDDDKLAMIATCRKNMNALSPEGEMAWMSPELVTWYQAENERRLGAQVEANNARIERQKQEQHVVRDMEQCAANCKREGLYCQNRCRHDNACENRCVEINHACLDRCESEAHDKLGR